MKQKTSVVLVDDHPVFRKGLRMLLEDEPDFTVVGEAGDGESAIELINELMPDIAVLDISMPGLNGIEVANSINASCPETKIIALSIHSEKRFVEDMLLAGASGYILKQSAPEDLVNGIRTVIQGDSFLSPSITSVVLSGLRSATLEDQLPAQEKLQIIGTKLYPPQVPENYLERYGVINKLEIGSQLSATLITGPAGYGKSTIVSSWLVQQPLPYGWITLDETDNDLRQFLNYFNHALQTMFPDRYGGIEDILESAILPPIQSIAIRFIQEIEEVGTDFILVLDDIHQVHEKDVYDLLSEVLRHPQEHMHFFIMGRRDPFLPIARLRGKHMISEVRTRDLRFSLDETEEYLNMLMDEVGNQHLAKLLHGKTEGWVAGMRLVLLSSDQESGLEEKLANIEGGSQFVQEYLFNEVLESQPREVRSNIIKIAVLDRFCGPLCEEVVGVIKKNDAIEFSGWDFIRALRQGNLFVVGLDTENIWYRFHNLFRQLLLKQLSRIYSPEKVNGLHKAASKWFVSNGFIEEGIKHAAIANDYDFAEEIVTKYRHQELAKDRRSAVERWMSLFPDEKTLSRPVLLLSFAWVCHNHFRLQETAAILERLELLSADEQLSDEVTGEVHFLHSVSNYWQGNSKACLQFLDRARKRIPESHHLLLGLVEMYEAFAHQMAGDKAIAFEKLNAKMNNIHASTVIFKTRLISSLSIVHFLEGDLYQSYDSAKRLQLMSAQNNLAYTETWGYYMMANASLQLYDLENSLTLFSVLESKTDIMQKRAAVDALAGLALTYFFQQNPDAAFAVSERLDKYVQQTQIYHLITIAHSLKARLFLLQGNENAAGKYMRLMGQKYNEPTMFTWLEIPELTRARILISMGTSAKLKVASAQLSKLKKQVTKTNNTCQLVDILVLETMVLVKAEGVEYSRKKLEEALTLAAAGGWVRPFIEAGRRILELLDMLELQSDNEKRHIKVIQTAAAKVFDQAVKQPNRQLHPHDEEILTSREFEILQLLSQRLRNKEIGQKLFISPETVKSHIKKIFSKLHAVNRRDAVDKGKKLGLLGKIT